MVQLPTPASTRVLIVEGLVPLATHHTPLENHIPETPPVIEVSIVTSTQHPVERNTRSHKLHPINNERLELLIKQEACRLGILLENQQTKLGERYTSQFYLTSFAIIIC